MSVFLSAHNEQPHYQGKGPYMGNTIGHNELRKRTRILVDGEPWEITDSDFVKPGKGQAFTRVKIKNLLTGRTIERTYKSSESAELADMRFTSMQYLYGDGDSFTFMDTETYEQVAVAKEIVGDAAHFLLESCHCDVGIWNDRVISVTPPNFMEFTVAEAEPAVRGDTATNITKRAVIETGYEINVPVFIEPGNRVKLDTRTGEYLGRV